jgi:hypothetical protein
LALLADSWLGEEDGNEAVLSKRQTEFRMTSDLEREGSVSSLVNKIRLGWSSHRKAAQNEWSRGKTEDLVSRVSLLAHQRDAFRLAQFLTRNE